jgi:hypothetical protein
MRGQTIRYRKSISTWKSWQVLCKLQRRAANQMRHQLAELSIACLVKTDLSRALAFFCGEVIETDRRTEMMVTIESWQIVHTDCDNLLKIVLKPTAVCSGDRWQIKSVWWCEFREECTLSFCCSHLCFENLTRQPAIRRYIGYDAYLFNCRCDTVKEAERLHDEKTAASAATAVSSVVPPPLTNQHEEEDDDSGISHF